MTQKKNKHIAAVIGTGYVGLVTGACLAELGHEVICVDANQEKIAKLKQGKISLYEPGLSDIIKKNLKSKKLAFDTDLGPAVQRASIIFVCVGTPLGTTGEMDLSDVEKVAKSIGQNMQESKIIVMKSTIPIGTANDLIVRTISRYWKGSFEVVSNPEFLREGSAVADFLEPDRIVIGSNSSQAAKALLALYRNIDCPKLVTSIESAEMIKYASNAFLAAKISFINEIANISERMNADIEEVALGMGLDKRIGREFLKAGFGYGGSCLPKDIKSFYQIVTTDGYNFKLLKAVFEVNESQKGVLLEKIKSVYPSKQLQKKTIAVLGLAFKDNTDDIRDSVAINITKRLRKSVASIRVYDPHAMDNAKKILGDTVEFSSSAYKAVKDADLIVIATEWTQFQKLHWKKIMKSMRKPVIVDGKNLLDPKKMKKLGFQYISIGRRTS
ncbi:UDP-glucose/GDP-mannose dehydrogenase family protein [Patescibacteria group bacterium]|nr:UDP-glucose/GDP-mannose dehydrogenase family protein [Patescibacteria group bacterium]